MFAKGYPFHLPGLITKTAAVGFSLDPQFKFVTLDLATVGRSKLALPIGCGDICKKNKNV